jgi:hypothetical protein
VRDVTCAPAPPEPRRFNYDLVPGDVYCIAPLKIENRSDRNEILDRKSMSLVGSDGKNIPVLEIRAPGHEEKMRDLEKIAALASPGNTVRVDTSWQEENLHFAVAGWSQGSGMNWTKEQISVTGGTSTSLLSILFKTSSSLPSATLRVHNSDPVSVVTRRP